jgi:hypothetical protein
MQAAKNWCDGERVKKLGILMSSKQGLGASLRWEKYNETRTGHEIKGLHRNLDAETFTSLNLDTEAC